MPHFSIQLTAGTDRSRRAKFKVKVTTDVTISNEVTYYKLLFEIHSVQNAAEILRTIDN